MAENTVDETSTHFSSDTSSEPKWISRPIADLLNDVARQKELVHLSTRGIAGLMSAPIVAEAAARIRNEQLTEERKRYEQEIADMAKRELADGFPLLYSQAVIALWHTLENHMRRIVVAWLTNDPNALQVDEVKRLKIKLGDYFALDDIERMYFIADQLDQDVSAPLKLGVGRFEALLAPFGLSGQVDDIVRKAVFELQQVRNVLVHRGGQIDRHFLEKCPWSERASGELIQVTHQMYKRFELAVFAYAMTLLTRIEVRFSVNTDWSKKSAADAVAALRRLSSDAEHMKD
jgi:hypothetical protein